jgi:hypothetical protein
MIFAYIKEGIRKTEQMRQMSQMIMGGDITTKHENAYPAETNGGMRFAFPPYGKWFGAITRRHSRINGDEGELKSRVLTVLQGQSAYPYITAILIVAKRSGMCQSF